MPRVSSPAAFANSLSWKGVFTGRLRICRSPYVTAAARSCGAARFKARVRLSAALIAWTTSSECGVQKGVGPSREIELIDGGKTTVLRYFAKAVLLSVLILGSSAHAEQWQHLKHLPGGSGCAARLPGKDVDTLIAFNNNGRVLLLAGRPDWRIDNTQGMNIGLRIDDSKVNHLEGFAAGSIILVLVRKSLVDRLKRARDIYWTFPFGAFHAAVSGFGSALDWLRKCNKEGQSTSVGKPSIFQATQPRPGGDISVPGLRLR